MGLLLSYVIVHPQLQLQSADYRLKRHKLVDRCYLIGNYQMGGNCITGVKEKFMRAIV